MLLHVKIFLLSRTSLADSASSDIKDLFVPVSTDSGRQLLLSAVRGNLFVPDYHLSTPAYTIFCIPLEQSSGLHCCASLAQSFR